MGFSFLLNNSSVIGILVFGILVLWWGDWKCILFKGGEWQRRMKMADSLCVGFSGSKEDGSEEIKGTLRRQWLEKGGRKGRGRVFGCSEGRGS